MAGSEMLSVLDPVKFFIKMLAFVRKALYNNPCVMKMRCAISSVGRAPDS